MLVRTNTGTKCPKEDKPREYITEEPVNVPDTAYYRRLIAEGSLILVEDGPQTPKGKRGGDS